MLVMGVVFSFLATLILCARDRFRWRRSKVCWPDYNDESASENAEYRPSRWWQQALLLILVVPFAVVIIPVVLGAVAAMILYAVSVRYRWFRGAVRRLLRQRGVDFSWLLSPPPNPCQLYESSRRLTRCTGSVAPKSQYTADHERRRKEE